MAGVLLKNIDKIISGDIEHPIILGDALLLQDGRIKQVGKLSDIDSQGADTVIDCQSTTVAPGLIDSHCHTVFGDYTPRQQQIGFLESAVHGGVTTFISAGEPHLPGRPKDAAGAKALAILASKSYANFRPGGGKVMGGSVILEKGLSREDFMEMAGQGVRTVGEVGLGTVKDPEEAASMIEWAKEAGMTVMMHTGGTSIPGSSTVTAEMVMKAKPDIASHINGGPTAVALDEVKKLVADTDLFLEIVHCGNPLVAVQTASLCRETGALNRIIIGNDAPSGTGVVSLGILRVINHLASLTEIQAEEALCMATGNTARAHNLSRGRLTEDLEADILIMDAPMGSVGEDALTAIEAGDVPGVGMVLVDGQVVVSKSRNTPPPKRAPLIESRG